MKSKGEIPDGSAADTGDDLVVCSFFSLYDIGRRDRVRVSSKNGKERGTMKVKFGTYVLLLLALGCAAFAGMKAMEAKTNMEKGENPQKVSALSEAIWQEGDIVEIEYSYVQNSDIAYGNSQISMASKNFLSLRYGKGNGYVWCSIPYLEDTVGKEVPVYKEVPTETETDGQTFTMLGKVCRLSEDEARVLRQNSEQGYVPNTEANTGFLYYIAPLTAKELQEQFHGWGVATIVLVVFFLFRCVCFAKEKSAADRLAQERRRDREREAYFRNLDIKRRRERA